MGLSYITNAELRKISRILITHHYDGHHQKNDRFWADFSTDLIMYKCWWETSKLQMVWREEMTWMNRRVSYGCSQLRLVGETQADMDSTSFFFFFSYYVHVIKLIFCLMNKNQYAYMCLPICVFNILYRRITWIEIETNQICSNPSPCVGGFGHGWGAFGHN